MTNPSANCTRNFEAPSEVLWDKFFYCDDLERDLVPVVKEYKDSSEVKDRIPRSHVTPPGERPWEIDSDTIVPEPFDLAPWLDARRVQLTQGSGAQLPLFGDTHPDREFAVTVAGGGAAGTSTQRNTTAGREIWLYQLEGEAVICLKNGSPATLK